MLQTLCVCLCVLTDGMGLVLYVCVFGSIIGTGSSGSSATSPDPMGGGGLLPMMENMMHTLLSSEVLYPSVKELSVKVTFSCFFFLFSLEPSLMYVLLGLLSRLSRL